MKRGLPRPRFDHEEYGLVPHPYSAAHDNLAIVHIDRQQECIDKLRCGVCGDDLTNDDIYVITEPARGLTNSPRAVDRLALHGKCAQITLRMCPHMKSSSIKLRKTSIAWYRKKWAETW